MARRRSRRDDESPCSESFRIDSDITRSRHSQAGERGPCRASSYSSSSASGDEGISASYKWRSRKPKLWKTSKAGTTIHERNSQQSPDSSSSSSSSDTDEEDSATDPDIESDYTSSDSEDDGYADGTKVNIARMRNRWEHRKQHQKDQQSPASKWADPNIALRAAGKREFTLFLRWCLRLRRGKNGRRSKGIRKASTLDTFWKNFLRHYEQINGDPMHDKLGRRMRKSIRKIVKRQDLDTEEKEKTPMYIEDLVPLQETVLRTMEKRFNIGFQRIQQCLYNLMACFTVNRINAMRHLQYKHLQCSIQRDPKDGPPRILLEITYKYLGVTQGNTFLIPEVIYDPSLMLSPHTFLLGMLFHDDAFRPPGIRSMADLRRLFLEGGRQQMEIPLKTEKAEHYVFCKVEAAKGKIVFHRHQPISVGSLSNQLQTFGEIAGFKWSLFTHRFRYGGGTIMNESGLVSDAQQNLIMKHTDIRTFLKHYLPRRIGTDMQALMRGLEPDSAMMRAVTRMGRWIDTRRPRELTDEQKASVEDTPELQEAIQKRDRLAQKLEHSAKTSDKKLDRPHQLKRNVTNTRNRLLYDLRKRVRDEFDSHQAVIDIERQLAGGALHDEETKEMLRSEEHMLPQQIFLLEKLTTWPTSESLEAEWRRRNEAVDAVRMYCDVREGGPRRGRRYPKQPPSGGQDIAMNDFPAHPSTAAQSPLSPSQEALRNAGNHIPKDENDGKPLGCFQCLKVYSRHKHVLRHFRATHLEDRHCDYCNEPVEDEMVLRRHAQENHGLKT
ncbi:uncharacterized protein N7479_009114 [Penicillium vulpinum]|uniref:uncharacterized protein n=1 Tax=Penicillium vulpinum TaxID=29845 RepID=UPI002547B9B2|nr:uncharacterized protein N7479_009114 [Penicillium vulpinum]KAJ5950701.1 hypothetical protein N7479_009114 [Penicillium vulpinum]